MPKNGNGKKRDGAGVFGWVAGGVALTAVAVAGFFGFRAFARTKKTATEIEDPDVPEKKKEEPATKTTTTTTTTTATKTLPAKTTTPYNKTMFAKPGDANGVLASLSDSYATAAGGGTSSPNFMAALAMWQEHWNILAKRKKLSPSSLNATRLKVDGKIGTQSRRGLEWSKGMNWAKRLADNQLGPTL